MLGLDTSSSGNAFCSNLGIRVWPNRASNDVGEGNRLARLCSDDPIVDQGGNM